MEHLDTILFVLVALGAIYWFLNFRLFPRSHSARTIWGKIKVGAAAAWTKVKGYFNRG